MLYPLLRRLEKQGTLVSEWNTNESRPRKFYALTAEGREVLTALTQEWRALNTALTERYVHAATSTATTGCDARVFGNGGPDRSQSCRSR